MVFNKQNILDNTKMKFETSVDYIDNALYITNKRLTGEGEYIYHTDTNILESIKLQLNYIKNVLIGEEKDKSRLKDIIIGYYAGKELDGNDPVFQFFISSAFYISRQIDKGVRIKLPHQVSNDYFDRIKKLMNQLPDDFDLP